jgi:hypothetical protein
MLPRKSQFSLSIGVNSKYQDPAEINVFALSISFGKRSLGTFSLPKALKTKYLAQSRLSPVQYLSFKKVAAAAKFDILSLKKMQPASSSQVAISTSFLRGLWRFLRF